MAGYPCHFERQDGSRFWFLGDTAWSLYTDSAEQRHDRAAASATSTRVPRRGPTSCTACCCRWQRSPDTIGNGVIDAADKLTYARAYCQSLSLAGHSDWRLPDIKQQPAVWRQPHR